MTKPLLEKVDAVLVNVPDIEQALEFYENKLGQELCWRKEKTAAVKLGDAELVLSTELNQETDILVKSVQETVQIIINAGGKVIVEPEPIEVGFMAVVADPFGNELTLVDLSKGLYQTDANGNVIGVA